MSRETLAVDVDEVLYPLVDQFLIHHNAQFGTRLTKDHFTSYDFEGVLGISVPETVKRVYEFQASASSDVEPVEQAREVIKRLAERFDLVVVTARNQQFEQKTNEWLSRQFATQFIDAHLIGYAPIMETPKTKASVCESIGAIALIDDSISHLQQCVDVGIEGILFGNYPWNSGEVPTGVTRCADWQAVAEHFSV